jgi:hypothetical protein
MRAIVADERYGAMKTNSEKKSCLAEYQAEKMKAAREEKREVMKRRREQFTELLREKDQIDSKMKFAEAPPPCCIPANPHSPAVGGGEALRD